MPPSSSLTQHLDEAEFLVVDVETTGLSPEAGDRLCEVGAVRLRGGAVIDTMGTLIDPQRPISAGAYAVNRISPRMLIGAPTFAEAGAKLKEMMKGAVLVAYNAPFDLSFLQTEMRLAGLGKITNDVVDALALARMLIPGLRRYPQENVASVLGIPFPVKHRAAEDALVTARIMTLFISVLKAYGLTSVRDLMRNDLRRVLIERRLSIATEALQLRKNLWIKYLSPHKAEVTERVVTPRLIDPPVTLPGYSPYLVAYCHTAQAERNFQIERILDARVLDAQ